VPVKVVTRVGSLVKATEVVGPLVETAVASWSVLALVLVGLLATTAESLADVVDIELVALPVETTVLAERSAVRPD
jgi:hypothetical protein